MGFVLQCRETVVVQEHCRQGERQEAVVVVRLYVFPDTGRGCNRAGRAGEEGML